MRRFVVPILETDMYCLANPWEPGGFIVFVVLYSVTSGGITVSGYGLNRLRGRATA